MKLKPLSARARAHSRVRRPRDPRQPKPRPTTSEGQHRVWSLLLPPGGFPTDRR
jgi:hypothetical protein